MRRLLILLTIVAVAVPLAADQKNVKLLTGLSDPELQRVMNMMRASLGVHCDFCHVVNGEEWDFASDEKKEKQKAREMIIMTRGLNENSFGGRAIISCHTCHRGSEHPVGLVALPQTPPPFPTPKSPRATGLPTAEEIGKKYAAAAGDAGKWKSFSAKATRETSDGKSTPIELQQGPDKIRVVAGKTEQTVSGSEGTIKSEEKSKPMSANEVERFRYAAAAYEVLPPSAVPKEGVVTGKEKINDHEAYALFSRLNPKTRQRLYFDANSGLLLRRVIIADGPVGAIPQQTDFDDWRDVGGTKYPFSIRVSMVDPWSSATRRFTEVVWK